MLTSGLPQQRAQAAHPTGNLTMIKPHPLIQSFQAALEASTFKYEQVIKHERFKKHLTETNIYSENRKCAGRATKLSISSERS